MGYGIFSTYIEFVEGETVLCIIFLFYVRILNTSIFAFVSKPK